MSIPILVLVLYSCMWTRFIIVNAQTCTSSSATDVTDMTTGQAYLPYWLESGFVTVGDESWVSVTTTSVHFKAAAAFVSLPDIPGVTAAEGVNVIPRIRNLDNTGRVMFEVKLYQANDTACSQTWHVPASIAPQILNWAVIETGTFQISGNSLFIGTGLITREDSNVQNIIKLVLLIS